jgi:hypothetical protein
MALARFLAANPTISVEVEERESADIAAALATLPTRASADGWVTEASQP